MKKAGRVGLVGVLSLVLFTAGGLGLWKATDSSPSQPVTTRGQQIDRLAGGPLIGAGSLGEAVASLQARLRVVPGDWRSFASLGLAYVQQARVTADPSYYPKAEGVLRRSLSLDRADNDVALTGLGALSLARHEFTDALTWGRQARAVNPYDDNVYGVMGDALVELGRYREAFATIQHMVDLKPDLGSYARVSYARELQGDVPGAIAAMRMALHAAGTAQDASWASYQLGELYWNTGRVQRAASAYHAALHYDDTFVPPLAGLAKVAWAAGDVDDAIARYRTVVARYPLPEHVIALGDLYATTGRTALAQRQYALVRTEEQLFRANGVNVDLELALFDADHGRPSDGLRAAREEWSRRHSVHVADALGWALYRDGRASEALPFARRALSVGMRNALFFFHAGMIERATGDTAAARRDLTEAVDINPHFSILYAGVAGHVLASLGGRS